MRLMAVRLMAVRLMAVRLMAVRLMALGRRRLRSPDDAWPPGLRARGLGRAQQQDKCARPRAGADQRGQHCGGRSVRPSDGRENSDHREDHQARQPEIEPAHGRHADQCGKKG